MVYLNFFSAIIMMIIRNIILVCCLGQMLLSLEAQIINTHTISNNVLTASFKSTIGPGTTLLELVSLSDKAGTGSRSMSFTDTTLNNTIKRSGGWTVVLRGDTINANSTKEVTMDTPGLTMTGPVIVSPYGTGEALVASSSGNVTFLNSTIDLRIDVAWAITGTIGDSRYLESAIHVFSPSLVALPGTNMTSHPFHMSTVDFPILCMPKPTADTHNVAIPVVGGTLVPILPGTASPLTIGFGPLRVPLLGYYNANNGDCLYFGDSDVNKNYKYHSVNTASSGSGPLVFETRTFVDDLMNNEDYTLPYLSRIGLFTGDWMTLAEQYRKFLTTAPNWYKGPVGGSNHLMATEMKCVTSYASLYSPVVSGDNNDMMTLDMRNFTSVHGSDSLVVVEGGSYPDEFDLHHNDSYLPGRPTFSATVREIQSPQNSHICTPYIASSSASSYKFLGIPPASASQHQKDIFASSITLEDGVTENLVPFPHNRANLLMCFSAGPGLWPLQMHNAVVDIADHTEMKGAYLDYYFSHICYSTNHAHPPGGGNWMVTSLMQEMASLRTAAMTKTPHGFFGLSTEGPVAYYTEQIWMTSIKSHRQLDYNHLAHSSPVISYPPGCLSIPLFRHCHDDTRIASVTGIADQFNPTVDPELPAWRAATAMLNFGQIPSATGSLWALGDDMYTNRTMAPATKFVRRLTSFLRDFLVFHNGTMQRPPDSLSIVNSAGFTGTTPKASTMLPLYTTELTAQTAGHNLIGFGMWKTPAPLQEWAFAVANPWIGSNRNTGNMTVSFIFDPVKYGIPTPFNVTFIDDAGTAHVLAQAQSAPYPVVPHIIEPGHVVYWKFH